MYEVATGRPPFRAASKNELYQKHMAEKPVTPQAYNQDCTDEFSALVLFLPVAFLYFRFVARHCGVGWQGIAGGVLFGAAEHGLLLLRIRFNVGPAMPAMVLSVIALAPVSANAPYTSPRVWRLWRSSQPTMSASLASST